MINIYENNENYLAQRHISIAKFELFDIISEWHNTYLENFHCFPSLYLLVAKQENTELHYSISHNTEKITETL